MSKVYKKMAWD